MPFEEVDYNPFAEGQVTEETPWGEVGVEAIKNIPESARNLAKDIFQVVMHPIKTGAAAVGMAAGVVEKAIPGEQPQEKYADAVGEFIKDRYGSEEAFKETIATDPVGVLGDVATMFTGAGATLKLTGKVSKVSKIAKAGEVASKIGTAIEPLNVASKGGVAALKALPESLPQGIYERAAKIPPSMKIKDRIDAVKTALEEAIPPTRKGVDLIWSKADEINTKIDGIIDIAEGQRIMTKDIAKTLDDVREFYSKDVVSEPHLKAIDRIEAQFLKGKAQTMSVREAQEMKKATYRILRKAFESETRTVTKDAKKSLARGAKEQIAKLFPEVDTLNKKEAALLNLNAAIAQRANTIANTNKLNFTALLAGTGVSAGTGSTTSALATVVMLGIITDARVQAKLAIALRKAKKAELGEVGVRWAGARLAAGQAGRAEL